MSQDISSANRQCSACGALISKNAPTCWLCTARIATSNSNKIPRKAPGDSQEPIGGIEARALRRHSVSIALVFAWIVILLAIWSLLQEVTTSKILLLMVHHGDGRCGKRRLLYTVEPPRWVAVDLRE